MNAFKQQCVELRKRDHTLSEIVKITGRSKTSVYFHIRGIPLSKTKQKKIAQAASDRAVRLANKRKGRAQRPYTPFTTWSPERVLLICHLIFDGELLKKRCVYHNRSDGLIQRVQRLMRTCYEYEPQTHVDDKSGVVRISYHNVELNSFLFQKATELMQTISQLSISCQREFLRAFFDDEGCMDFRPSRRLRRIRGFQKDKRTLLIVQQLLKNFNIDAVIREPNEIVITGKENLKRFQKEINFSRGVRLNPNRTNSIWKKDIEKRKLLDMAIRSFRS